MPIVIIILFGVCWYLYTQILELKKQVNDLEEDHFAIIKWGDHVVEGVNEHNKKIDKLTSRKPFYQKHRK